MTETYLSIGGIVVGVKSRNEPLEEASQQYRYKHFVLSRKPRRVTIAINLETMPRYQCFKFRELFRTERDAPKHDSQASRQLSDAEERYLGDGLDWRIGRSKNNLLIEGSSSGRYQLMIREDLTKGTVFIVNAENQWKVSDVVFGFLQVLIITYLAKYRLGLLFHSSGLWDGGSGYLFSGLSGAGKSTTSRIWAKTPGIRILNDDRIIVRRRKDGFYMYPTPWHGDYSEYLKGNAVLPAKLSKLFYIYHRKTNLAERVSAVEGFNYFIKVLFVCFWDKECLKFSFDYLLDLLSQRPCYKFGFKNDSKIIRYIRMLK